MAQFVTKAPPGMYFETGGVLFWDETVLPRRRNPPETKVRVSCSQLIGTAEMQFIFDLIWTQSYSRYLAAMGQPEGEQ